MADENLCWSNDMPQGSVQRKTLDEGTGIPVLLHGIDAFNFIAPNSLMKFHLSNINFIGKWFSTIGPVELLNTKDIPLLLARSILFAKYYPSNI
jgi:hypothetical protein